MGAGWWPICLARQTYLENYIMGTTIHVQYNTQSTHKKKHFFYFQLFTTCSTTTTCTLRTSFTDLIPVLERDTSEKINDVAFLF